MSNILFRKELAELFNANEFSAPKAVAQILRAEIVSNERFKLYGNCSQNDASEFSYHLIEYLGEHCNSFLNAGEIYIKTDERSLGTNIVFLSVPVHRFSAINPQRILEIGAYKYHLVGTTFHTGEDRAGHYIAGVCYSENNYFIANDYSHLQLADERNMERYTLNSLFYEKRVATSD